MKSLRPILTAALLGAGAIGLLSFAGCGGPPRHRPPMNEDLSDNAATRPVLLQGEQPFFAGRILARLIVTRSAGHGGPGGPEGGAPKHRPGGGGMMGGGAGGPPPGGGGGMGGGMGGPPPGGGDMGGEERAPAQPHFMGASGPGLRVQLQLIDQEPATAAPLTVEIVDFQSALGDFALKPDRLALAPGQTASPDAITSRMGVVAAEIPVQLTLRLAGQKEQQTVVLRAVTGNPPAPTAKTTQ